MSKAMKRPQLVHNWRDSWKWSSVRCLALIGVITVTWASIPQDLRDSAPRLVKDLFTGSLVVLGILGRITQPTDGIPAKGKKKRK